MGAIKNDDHRHHNYTLIERIDQALNQLADVFFASILTATIKTDTVTPTDLSIVTGVAKTLVLATSVYGDLIVPITTGKLPAANVPTWAAYSTNLKQYTFAVNDIMYCQSAEALHGYKEGTNFVFHVHIITNGLNDATARKLKFTIYYDLGDVNEAMAGEGNTSGEIDIAANEADKTHHIVSCTAVTGTGFKVGAIIPVTVKRVACTGTEPANDPFVSQAGVHYQIDTIGSRGETTK